MRRGYGLTRARTRSESEKRGPAAKCPGREDVLAARGWMDPRKIGARQVEQDKSKETEDQDGEAAKVRRYDRLAWVLFTLPILIVLFMVFSRSCGGGEA